MLEKKNNQKDLLELVASICWHIWKARNSQNFNGKQEEPHQTGKTIAN